MGSLRFRVLAGMCAAVLLVTACSSGDRGPRSAPAKGTAATSVLDKITPQQVCGLVDDASIKKAVGAAPDGADSRRIGKAPILMTYTCDYRMGVPGVTTEVSTTELDTSDQQVLDEAFTDYGAKNVVVQYERVPDLGLLAGYGPDPVLSGVDLNGQKLGVVVRVANERLSVSVAVLGQATPAQLKALAVVLLKNLETLVG